MNRTPVANRLSVEQPEEPDWTARLPLFVRIPLGLIGLASVVIGLAMAVYWMIGASMSAGHGGDPVPDLETAAQMVLPATLITFGVSAILCRSINRLAVTVVIFTVLVAHLAYLVT